MNFPLIRAQPDQSVISLSIKPLENSDPLIYSFNPNTHFIYNPHKLLPVITPPQRHFVEHMESNNQSFRQFSDHLRLHNNDFASLSLNDSIWSVNHGFGSKRPAERRNFDIRVGGGLSQSNNPTTHDHNPEFNAFNDGWRIGSGLDSGAQNSVNDGFNKGTHSKPIYMSQYYKNNTNLNSGVKGYNGNFQPNYSIGKVEDNHYHNNNNFHGGKNKKKEGKKESNKGNKDENSKKIFKTLPPAEALPRNETIGGYIFVCNNDTMEENLKRQLFGLPPRFRDSVRAITPGLPLFLYNYSTHQLHGIFEAASFGGSNIDSSAWEDKKHHGESRFPAQVRVQTRKLCEALDEDEFRPILHHYDGPKFRLELSVPEVLSLLDVFGKDKARA